MDDFYKQKFLITGARGFIGSALLDHLAGKGSEVHAISRSRISSKAENITWWQGNCANFGFMKSMITSCRPDVVFHLAGYVYGTRDLEAVIPSFHSNLSSTVNLMTLLAEEGCDKLVLAGSMEEPDKEELPVIPSSPYAASKWACEGYANMFHALYDLPVVNARIFMVYGPGQEEQNKLVPYLINSYLNEDQPKIESGDRLIDWIYIQDVVEGLVKLANTDGLNGARVDIGSGMQISVRDLAELLYELIAPPKEPRIGNKSQRKMEQVKVANLEKTKRVINWSPAISLKEGLKKTITWYKENQDKF